MKRVNWFQKPYFSFHEKIWKPSDLCWFIGQFWELVVEIFFKSKLNHILAVRSCEWKGSSNMVKWQRFVPFWKFRAQSIALTSTTSFTQEKEIKLIVFPTSSLHVDTESAVSCVVSQGNRNPDRWEAPTSWCYATCTLTFLQGAKNFLQNALGWLHSALAARMQHRKEGVCVLIKLYL